MSIAWSTVAFLVLLLPGFLFLVGLYLPESFTRETAPRSPLGHLAATVLISFAVHGLLFAITWSGTWPDVPYVRLDYLLQILQVEGLTDAEFAEIIANIEAYRWTIVGYILGTSLLGMVLGYETGSLIVSGPLRKFAEHGWVYDLKVEGTPNHPPGVLLKVHAGASRVGRALIPDPLRNVWKQLAGLFSRDELRTMTIAYVLTDISHEHRHIIYRGFLKAFAISKDGKPLYLVLRSAQRSYMLLEESGPHTGPSNSWTRIGGSPTARPGLPGPRLSSYLVVSGEHIVNLVFDRHVFQQTRAGLQALNAAYASSLRRTPPGRSRP